MCQYYSHFQKELLLYKGEHLSLHKNHLILATDCVNLWHPLYIQRQTDIFTRHIFFHGRSHFQNRAHDAIFRNIHLCTCRQKDLRRCRKFAILTNRVMEYNQSPSFLISIQVSFTTFVF